MLVYTSICMLLSYLLWRLYYGIEKVTFYDFEKKKKKKDSSASDLKACCRLGV